MASEHLPKKNEQIWEKYSLTWDTLGFIQWYLYMYGNDREFTRILEKPYFYPEVFEEYENDEEWHNGGE